MVSPATARPVRIAPASFRDLAAVAAIQREAFRPGLAYGRFALGLLWGLPTTTFLVARDATTGEILGNVITDRIGGNTRIANVAVARRARRAGIGSALMREVEARCAHGDLVLAVQAENTAAQRLYLREGYVRTSISRDYYGPGQDGYMMKKARRGSTGITVP